MQNIFFYKLTADTGAAPCVEHGLLSLAICKPKIRRRAKCGDLIFGFAANSLNRDNRLIYIAAIGENLSDGSYYRSKRFARRRDCIYRLSGNNFVRRRGALYHDRPTDLVHDLGKPPHYPNRNVLLSNEFRYFGGGGDGTYKIRYPLIKRAVERLGQGHRVNLPQELRHALLALKKEIWESTARRVLGKPSSLHNSHICYRGKSCAII